MPANGRVGFMSHSGGVYSIWEGKTWELAMRIVGKNKIGYIESMNQWYSQIRIVSMPFNSNILFYQNFWHKSD